MRTTSSFPNKIQTDLTQNSSEQKTKGSSFLRGIKSLFSKNKTATDSSINNAEGKITTQKSGGRKAAEHVSTKSNQTANIRSAIPSFKAPQTDMPPPAYSDIFPDQKSASPPPPSDLPPAPPAPTDKPPPPPLHSGIKMNPLELKKEALSKALNNTIPAEKRPLRMSDKNQLIGKINNAIPFEKLKLDQDHKNFDAMNEKINALNFSIQFFCASAVQDNDKTHQFTDNKMQGLKKDLIEDFSTAFMLTTNNPIANPELAKAQTSLTALLDKVLADRNKDQW